MALEDAKKDIDRAFTTQSGKGLAFENAFAGATSFLRRRYTKDLTDVDLAITGVPFDQAVTHRTGTRFGPRAIREASALQPFDPPWGWDFSPLEAFNVIDYGDLAFDYAHTPSFPGLLEAHIGQILQSGAAALTLGGDHFITLPILKAHAANHGPLALIHFDAHSDTWVDDDMSRIDHGTFLYKATKLGLVDPKAAVQIGIRTHNDDFMGYNVIAAREVHENPVATTAAKIKAIIGDRPAYLTFDIDCLDPAFAPGTGTPVSGGLASWQAAAILRDLAGLNIVGGDVVEVSPPYDTTGATAIAGAHVATEIMCLILWNRR